MSEPDLQFQVVRTLVLYALCEHQLGHAGRIEVTVSGHDFKVSDNGRGHAVSRTVEGAPYLDFIYGHLAFPFGRTDSPPIQLQGLGMSLLNQLCARLVVTVRKPSRTLNLAFTQGELAAHELVEASNSETGNSVAGSLSPALAPRAINEGSLMEWLASIQAANPSLELVLNGKRLRSPGKPP